MYLEAKETARLYKLLTEKLGNDTTEAMFKYIDNKTERSVEATIKTLATKDDLHNTALLLKEELHNTTLLLKEELHNTTFLLKDELHNAITGIRSEMADMRKENADTKAENIKWMFIFWIGQVAAMLAIILLFVKK